jgi:hypothetical protein
METVAATAARVVKANAKKAKAKKPQSRAVSTVVAQPPAAQPPANLMQVIANAVMDPRCDVEKMRALLDMQRDIEDRDAKKAFTRAFNALQAELPIINKDGKIDHGEGTTARGNAKLKTRFATYPNLNRVVGPLLKKHGFTFSTSMEPDPSGPMIAISTLSHVEGDSRRTHFRLTADTTGAKNNQQGWGSSQQYGMRYNMIALLNIVTEAREDADNDGFPGAGENISPAQLAALIKMADDAGADKVLFCGVMKVDSMADIPAARFEEAKTQLQRKLNAKAKKAAASAVASCNR